MDGWAREERVDGAKRFRGWIEAGLAGAGGSGDRGWGVGVRVVQRRGRWPAAGCVGRPRRCDGCATGTWDSEAIRRCGCDQGASSADSGGTWNSGGTWGSGRTWDSTEWGCGGGNSRGCACNGGDRVFYGSDHRREAQGGMGWWMYRTAGVKQERRELRVSGAAGDAFFVSRDQGSA
jgi:hypothetical protein